MRVGFTGNQHGLTAQQKAVICYFRGEDELHHGDCVGADSQAHDILMGTTRILIHPPINPSKRAWRIADYYYPLKEYLVRNKDIVNCTDILIACPDGYVNKLRSGTWSTIRYARSMRKPVLIIYPDGSIE